MLQLLPVAPAFDPAPQVLSAELPIGSLHRAVFTSHNFPAQMQSFHHYELFGPNNVPNFSAWLLATSVSAQAFPPVPQTPPTSPAGLGGIGYAGRPANPRPPLRPTLGGTSPSTPQNAPGRPLQNQTPAQGANPFVYIQTIPDVSNFSQLLGGAGPVVAPILTTLYAFQNATREVLIVSTAFQITNDPSAQIAFSVMQRPA